ncbi:FecCD family ABC transporter permease [Deinococcus cellulosilyticus]|uniref:Iron ABC transporter permease n=1 Tax=Deinococcus cellulosilyticus (strain DSM 18568 / NBRC 106333 / KACC 11606 / 5516J-15) TaxID=1223518 RepID=A0A511N0C0_DEIC1|nr:iron ABC transporter permease [Deinococcus cellulosilyticus]GEM45951.1 iron ABC transporter permease [Deinococcus cellulosilyticus NBRC 106333 = KACC 11606]
MQQVLPVKRRVYPTLLLTVGALLLCVLLAVSLGTVNIPVLTTLTALLKGFSGQARDGLEVIVWDVRFPRVLMGMLVGACLAMSGATYQGLFRNPLADPYLMGVASGASLGATVGLVLGVPNSWIPVFALVASLLSVALTLTLSAQGKVLKTTNLILTGVVVGSLSTAISTYLMLQHKDDVRQVFFWTLGNLSFASWQNIQVMLPYLLLGGIFLQSLAKPLNTLQLGEATAYSLGIPVDRLKWLLIIASSLITAVAVSYVGIIGFVGLIAPHIMRRLVGSHYPVLIPMSALLGGVLLVAADLLARTLIRPAELPVGIVMTLVGGGFFLYLLRRNA